MSFSRKISRREFIKTSSAGLTAIGLASQVAGCIQIDQIISGYDGDETARVVILGAGIAGLTSARELRAAGVPFHIFEGSNRIGGRTYTLESFNAASQRAELGAEWVRDNDQFIINLCRELKMELIPYSDKFLETKNFQAGVFHESAKWSAEIRIHEKKLAEQTAKFKEDELDGLSVDDLAQLHKKRGSSLSADWLSHISRYEFGAEPQDISALYFLSKHNNDGCSVDRFFKQKYKIAGGSQSLAKNLYDRVAGVIPGHVVTLAHELVAIEKGRDSIHLIFNHNNQEVHIETKVVICALPLANLRSIKSLEELTFTDSKKNAMQELGTGAHSKIVASYNGRFWAEKGNRWVGDLSSQSIWESSLVHDGPLASARSVLSSLIGGKASGLVSSSSIEGLRADLNRIVPGDWREESSQIMNWSQNKWSHGSVSYYKPKQFIPFGNILAQSENKDKFIFAGEHTSSYFKGTMNGAVESGIRAAQLAAVFKSELEVKFKI